MAAVDECGGTGRHTVRCGRNAKKRLDKRILCGLLGINTCFTLRGSGYSWNVTRGVIHSLESAYAMPNNERASRRLVYAPSSTQFWREAILEMTHLVVAAAALEDISGANIMQNYCLLRMAAYSWTRHTKATEWITCFATNVWRVLVCTSSHTKYRQRKHSQASEIE